MSWSLDIAGTRKTLAEWRVNGVSLRRQNLAGDLLTFTAPRSGVEAQLCDYGDTVALYDADGVCWFKGTNQTIPDTISAAAKYQSYTIASPWRYLVENIFQQPWYNGTVYTDHILLIGTIGGNIKAVLDYALSNDATLFQYIEAELTALSALPPTNEFTEKTCAQVIIEQLNFAPDTVVWFDYSTTPPTLRFAQRGSLTAVNARLASYNDVTMPIVSNVQLTARPDLQLPSVKLNFEVLEEIDGQQLLVPSVEVAPDGATGREDGAFNATLTIQGRTIQNVTGTIECQTIDTTSLEWWKQHVAVLRDEKTSILTGPADVTRKDRDGVALTTTYDRELISGQIAPWMDIDWQIEVITATFAYQTISDSNVVRVEDEKTFTLELVTTNAPAGESTYTAVASADSGDALPVGLAAALYASMSELHYSGSFTLQQADCDGTIDLGNVVNLYGARAGHQTMRALVQEVLFNIDGGLTEITVGPPRHLGLSDLLALLQRFRVRRRWTNPDTQETGDLGEGSGDLALGQATANTNAIPGASVSSLFAVQDGSTLVKLDATGKRVRLEGDRTFEWNNGAGILYMGPKSGSGDGTVDLRIGELEGKTIRFRVMPVCTAEGTKRVIIPCSEIY